jgi:chromosome segregation protein
LYLKSLTLRGFKSFASTTTMRFEPGVTCVVGPNGSGKSNVVDALSWVMGEQGAKHLRGGKMEDVIFAGTAARAPLGRAEVQLTIDNSDGALPIDYSEVTISRTMFRSGGSEYAINGHTARLLDVQELLSDSGIGREMHVIVGQGQLDTILNATPETRRGLIEEAAGVLKHRKRKEKAERKLDATAANLNRLNDLLGELRRQLKPLGKQAEVARKAQTVQAEVFDAQARLYADEYLALSSQLSSDQEAEDRMKAEREAVEAALEQARAAEQAAEEQAAELTPQLNAAQETWFSLAGLKERAASTASIAAERLRHLKDSLSSDYQGRDPHAIEREAQTVRTAEKQQREDMASKEEALAKLKEERAAAETQAKEVAAEYSARQRAIADRREGLARLEGEVNGLRAKAESAGAESERYAQALAEAEQRKAQSKHDYAQLETKLATWSAAESGLDSNYEKAEELRAEAQERLEQAKAEENTLAAKRAALAARVEGLKLGLERGGAEEALLATSEQLDGLLGQVAALISVPKGYELAISTALGAASDAVAVVGLDNAVASFEHLKREDLGRAGLLLAGSPISVGRENWPGGVEYAIDVVKADERLEPAFARALYKVAVVDDLDQAEALVQKLPELTVVTKGGDLLSSWFASGGSQGGKTLIEIRSAVDEAEAELAQTQEALERLRFGQAKDEAELSELTEQAEAALARLNESDAEHAALAEEASRLQQAAKAADELIARYAKAAEEAQATKTQAGEALAALESRLERAQAEPDAEELDPAERDRLNDLANLKRQQEMQAQLELRTVQERVRALADRAQSLERSAQAEQSRQEQAAVRRAALEVEQKHTLAVQQAVEWLLTQIEDALAQAELDKQAAQRRRAKAEEELVAARRKGRELAKEFEDLTAAGHRDQLAKAELKLKVESLAQKVMDELGYEPDALVAEYGPDQPVTVTDGDESIEMPYNRAEQEKRLKAAKRDLAVLGKVNPLALEEFQAMQERHTYLAEQLEDLRKTRADLIDIIQDVDNRMQEVFKSAYEDVSREFVHAFDRLFPGGEGKLVLTEPDSWLTTGVEVEAKPAGKKVKRLSLLSGGERSLTAIAFLVALFKARPSPFYILDEVEAALDDSNLGRLLGIYEELRENSQLLIITHQKRTMEIADSLYGITMGKDGVTKVISQRLVDE